MPARASTCRSGSPSSSASSPDRRATVTALELTAAWPVPHVSAAVLSAGSVVETIGDPDRVQRLASISKPMSAWAILVAVEEGVISLDQPVGQPGCTLRHLLAHAGGYPFEGTEPIARPETDAHLLQQRLQPRRSRDRSGDRHDVRRVSQRGDLRPALDDLERPAWLGRRGCQVEPGRHDSIRRRSDAPHADPRLHRSGRPTHALPGARRYRSGRGSLCAVPLGTGIRGSRQQRAALDRNDQLVAHLRPLRWVGHDVLDRSRPGPGGGRVGRPRLRRVGAGCIGGLARTVRRGDRRTADAPGAIR